MPPKPAPTPAPKPAPKIENLRIMWQKAKDKYDTPEVDRKTSVYQVTLFCINLAFDMLESARGKQALLETGNGILKVVPARHRKDWVVTKDSVDAAFVDTFLKALRSDFPNLLLSTRVPGRAVTRRQTWNVKPGTAYNPKLAAYLFLDKAVSHPLF